MTALFLRPLRLAQALIGNDTPRQSAWGFSLGMLVGLLPKGNLLAIAMAMLLCGTKVNRAAGLLAIGLFSYVGWALDDFAHRLGSLVIPWQPLRPALAGLYEAPLGPFVGLNNTVAVGQLLIGLYLFYPAYKASYAAAAYIRPARHRLSHEVPRDSLAQGRRSRSEWGLDG